MKLSIVIPAKNEEKRLPATLGALSRYAREHTDLTDKDLEVIVVVNGSTDETYEIVKVFATHFPFIKPYNVKAQIGKGGAIKYGFNVAKGDVIGFVDGDASSSAHEVFRVYDEFINSGADIGIADRYSKEAVIQGKMPISRTIFSKGFRLASKLLFQISYKDTQCGLKFFKKDTGKLLMKLNDISGWTFDLNVLIMADKFGFKTISIPTIWEFKTHSQLKVGKAIKSVPKELLTSFFKYHLFTTKHTLLSCD